MLKYISVFRDKYFFLSKVLQRCFEIDEMRKIKQMKVFKKEENDIIANYY